VLPKQYDDATARAGADRDDYPTGVAPMAAKTLVGYTDRLSVVAGDRQSFMISAEHPFDARLVRVICGEAGERFEIEPVASSLQGHYPAGPQTAIAGSYGRVPALPGLQRGTVSVHFMPTLVSAGHEQVLLDLAHGSLTVSVDQDGLRVRVSTSGPMAKDAVVGPLPVFEHAWHWMSFRFDTAGALLTVVRIAGNVGERDQRWSSRAAVPNGFQVASGAMTIGARLRRRESGTPQPEAFFNGRLELPWIAAEPIEPAEAMRLGKEPDALRADPRVVAAWDFSREIGSDRCIDVCRQQLHGAFFNTPTRAVRGIHWDGSEQDWKRAPLHYGAVHFHEDDLTDARWQPTLDWAVPEDLSSGVYALELTSPGEEDYVLFFVRPSPRHRKASAVLLVPTATYLAYANTRFSMYAALLGLEPMTENNAYLDAHPEVGLSLYERHRDGSGVHHSSYLRPVLNLKPKVKPWGFTADTNITAWLHHSRIPFDVVTDEDLHREGAALLAPYPVVITGTHPEYVSTGMLQGLEDYLAQGGRFMYLGGNGFYWRITVHPTNPALIQLRRAEGRGLAWDSAPGEYYHSFNGEYGGLWRMLGRAPNRLTGVGFVALAHDGSTGYRRQPDGDDPRAGFIVEGTSEHPVFGAYGSVCGGAVSQEIDRCNRRLGSPPHALVLASSENHPTDFALVREEIDAHFPASDGPRLRADMTFFETPAGGAVFSTGSIGFAGALAHNGYRNDICRIATNVLTRFMDPTPFPMPEGDSG
jgi:N,N-dimethylformamidase